MSGGHEIYGGEVLPRQMGEPDVLRLNIEAIKGQVEALEESSSLGQRVDQNNFKQLGTWFEGFSFGEQHGLALIARRAMEQQRIGSGGGNLPLLLEIANERVEYGLSVWYPIRRREDVGFFERKEDGCVGYTREMLNRGGETIGEVEIRVKRIKGGGECVYTEVCAYRGERGVNLIRGVGEIMQVMQSEDNKISPWGSGYRVGVSGDFASIGSWLSCYHERNHAGFLLDPWDWGGRAKFYGKLARESRVLRLSLLASRKLKPKMVRALFGEEVRAWKGAWQDLAEDAIKLAIWDEELAREVNSLVASCLATYVRSLMPLMTKNRLMGILAEVMHEQEVG